MDYFMADLHLGGIDQMLTYLRPFDKVQDMNDTILSNIHNTVDKGEKLRIVGDLFNYTKDDHTSWKETMKLVKFPFETELVMGNNERKLLQEEFSGDMERFTDAMLNAGFSKVIPNPDFVTLHGVEFCTAHRPQDCSKTCLNIYGHVHFAGRYSELGINVAADANQFIPVSDFVIGETIQHVIDYHQYDLNLQLVTHIDNYKCWWDAYGKWLV